MSCPHLTYRRADEAQAFDHERPHCPVAGFVSPMQADVCNDRYDFDHATHCDVFDEIEGARGESGDRGEAQPAVD